MKRVSLGSYLRQGGAELSTSLFFDCFKNLRHDFWMQNHAAMKGTDHSSTSFIVDSVTSFERNQVNPAFKSRASVQKPLDEEL